MTLTDAITSGFSNYVTFSGRARRAEFWYWALFLFIMNIALSFGEVMMFAPQVGTYGPLTGLFSLGTFLPSLAIAVRRLHDRDRSGWWYLLVFLPLIGWIVLLIWFCLPGSVGANRFGADPLGGGNGPSQVERDETRGMPPRGFRQSSIPQVKNDD